MRQRIANILLLLLGVVLISAPAGLPWMLCARRATPRQELVNAQIRIASLENLAAKAMTDRDREKGQEPPPGDSLRRAQLDRPPRPGSAQVGRHGQAQHKPPREAQVLTAALAAMLFGLPDLEQRWIAPPSQADPPAPRQLCPAADTRGPPAAALPA